MAGLSFYHKHYQTATKDYSTVAEIRCSRRETVGTGGEYRFRSFSYNCTAMGAEQVQACKFKLYGRAEDQ